MKIILFVLVSALAITAADAKSGKRLKVEDKSFTVITTEADGSFTEQETKNVMLVPNRVCYSWLVKLTEQDRTITLTERFELPAPPVSWGGLDNDPIASKRIKNGRRVAESPIDVDLNHGIATNTWCVAEGDPPGKYRIDIVYRGKRLHSFKFNVLPPPSVSF